MAGEIIAVTADHRRQILVTQSGYRDTILTLEDKLSRGIWRPDPPVILTPMPVFYKGPYAYHLYNGNHRYLFSGKHELPLNALIATNIDDIPIHEIPSPNMTPDLMLTIGLRNFLWKLGKVNRFGYDEGTLNLEQLIEILHKAGK